MPRAAAMGGVERDIPSQRLGRLVDEGLLSRVSTRTSPAST
jgi:DNA-binding HxlR family transcriptional regulator